MSEPFDRRGSMNVRVLGIDPSLTATGLALPTGATRTIITAAQDKDNRLSAIYDNVCADAEGVDLAVVEDLPTHAHSAGILGMVQGVVRLALQRGLIPYVTVPPATLKTFATGKGNSTKADMRVELFRRRGIDLRNDNEVDAWWLRALGHAGLNEPIISVPAPHLRALLKVHFPDGIGRSE